jgi:hypothetical protein
MSKARYPKKGFASYMLPFVLIIALLVAGWYIVQNNLNISDLQRIFQAPPVAKDEKVSVIYLEGDVQVKPWSEEKWQTVKPTSFLQAGDTIKTATGGLLVLRFFEGSEIRLDKQTEIKLIRLDKDATVGDHVAIDLIAGRLWRRGTDANTQDADFIINTNLQIIQMNKAVVIDVATDPDQLSVIGGNITTNVAEKVNGTRKPVSQLSLAGGEQVTLDELTMDQLKAGEKGVILPISDEYRSSEWYIWNIEKEEKLGYVVEVATSPTPPKEDLAELEEGLVTVASPKQSQSTGSKVTVSGTYDKAKITSIWVNNDSATLGINDEWEITVPLTQQQNTVTVTALEKNSTVKKEVTSIELNVDTSGPLLGSITNPEVDANGNGTITSDTLELTGEVDTDAEKVCVSHNDTQPAYCLKQFTPGSKIYRYLGGVSYGNVVSGKNKYEIYAYDELGNISQKTIYLFKDTAKPEEKIIEDETATSPNETSSTVSELQKPTITSPDPNVVFETSEAKVTITGTVDKGSRSLLINDRKAGYEVGSGIFEVVYMLEPGENLLRIQTTDSQGNKSKTATLTVIYLEESEVETDDSGVSQ